MNLAVKIETRPKAECPPPGVYYNIPSKDYHEWDAISSSYLKAYANLPSTSRAPYEAGDDANVGTGIHALTLQGEDALNEECFILPMSCEGKNKAALAEREQYQLLHPDKRLLPPVYGSDKIPTLEVLRCVDDSLRSHPKIGEVLDNAEKEVSLVWIDKTTGLKCKARLDIWDGAIIWDLKKTRALSAFTWQIRELQYYVQAGFYFWGATECGLEPTGFGFIPCEAFPPYQVACGYVDPDKLEAAVENSRRLVGLVKQSQETGNFPNYRIPEHIYSLDDIKPDDLMQIY